MIIQTIPKDIQESGFAAILSAFLTKS